MISSASALLMPILLFCFGYIMLFSRADRFEAFLRGAKTGLDTAVSLIPVLVGLVTATTVFRASGLIDRLIQCITPLFSRIGADAQLLPLILLRPISGSASISILRDLFAVAGTDTLTGITASVLLGSSETMIYVMSVYYGAIGVRKTRHTLFCATLVTLFSVFLSMLICRLLF